MKINGIVKIVLLLLLNTALIFVLYTVTKTAPEEIEPLKEPVVQTVVSETEKPEEIIVEPELIVIEPREITLSAYSDYFTVGTQMKIEAVLSPADATMTNITWTSEDDSIARVGQDGTVEGVSKGSTYIKASADNGVCAVRKVFVMKPGLIFLSPSRQTGNLYFNYDTSECREAFKMSGYCMERLQAVGFEVYECPIKYDIRDRDELAADMNADCYVAIHTNAGGTESGTMAFYHKKYASSIRLALAVYETVAPLTPPKDSGIKNGYSSNYDSYIEVQQPTEAGVPSTLLEVDFHDKESSGQWLLDNPEPIGIAIADGIMHFMYENY